MKLQQLLTRLQENDLEALKHSAPNIRKKDRTFFEKYILEELIKNKGLHPLNK